jgi:hypothetical protein
MSHGILINGTDDIATIQDDCHYVDLEDFINEHFRKFI